MTPAAIWLLETAIKVSLVVGAGLAAAACLRRSSAALRHWILSAAMAASLALPLAAFVMPVWQLPVDAARLAARAPAASPRAASRVPPRSTAPPASAGRAGSASSYTQWIVAIWAGGAAAGVLILCVGLGRLAWIASRSRRIENGPWLSIAGEIRRTLGLRRDVALLQTDRPSLLVTCGFVAPKVMLPRTADGWTDARIRIVLAHELAHVRRADWLIQMMAAIARCAFWFNPVLWIACRRLRHESEQAADDLVLGCGVGGSEYAAHLLDLARDFARTAPWVPAAAIARPSSLERRITMMLKTDTAREPLGARRKVGIVFALSALAVAVASAQATLSTFSGTVFDSLNGFLPGVTMTLTNTQTNAKYQIASDRQGHFEFVGLPAGRYVLDTSLPGFMALHGSLDIAGADLRRDVSLSVGSLTETVTSVAKVGAPAADVVVSERAAPLSFEAHQVCSAPPAPGGMGGNIRMPVKLVHVVPRFPASIVAPGVEGLVRLRALIGADGRIRDIETESATRPEFEIAAREAVGLWRFTQTLLNCVPIEVSMDVAAYFKVEE